MVRKLFALALLLCSGCNFNKEKIHGYVEGEYQYISPTSSGILKELLVTRGDDIKAGRQLFILDDLELKVAIESANAEIRQAELLLREKERDYERGKGLVDDRVISMSEFDRREAEYKVSKAKLDVAQQNLLSAEKKLVDSAPFAKNDSFVDNSFYKVGEFVEAGKPVVSILSIEDIKVRFFVPQNKIATLSKGDYVEVSCDGCDHQIKAKITYIAKEAEYTPPVIYSSDSRQKMVFMVEARPDQFENCLHPGLPIDVDLGKK